MNERRKEGKEYLKNELAVFGPLRLEEMVWSTSSCMFDHPSVKQAACFSRTGQDGESGKGEREERKDRKQGKKEEKGVKDELRCEDVYV